jgi:peroxiredoxin
MIFLFFENKSKEVLRGVREWSKLERRLPIFARRMAIEKEICLKSYQGKLLVLYFYLEDDTSVCTRVTADFRAALQDLRTLGAEVLWIWPKLQKY